MILMISPIICQQQVARSLLLLTSLELDNVHFLGIGEGARMGYLLSAWEPNRLRSMAVLDGHPYIPEEYEKKTWNSM